MSLSPRIVRVRVGTRRTALTSQPGWPSQAAALVRQGKSPGATWILPLVRLLCAATLRRVRRIGNCAACRLSQMLAHYLSECAANVLTSRCTQKYSASANARRRLIVRARKLARIALLITTCDICLPRAASKAVWTFQLSPAGSDTKTVVLWQ